MRKNFFFALSAVVAALFLPCAAHAQCENFNCESWGVYNPNTNTISGYSLYSDYEYTQGWYLEVDSYVSDPNGNYYWVGSDDENDEVEVDFSYVPGMEGVYTILGYSYYNVEGSWAYDGASYYGVGVEYPVITSCTAPSWVIGSNSFTCSGSGFSDTSPSLFYSGNDGNNFIQSDSVTVNSDSQITVNVILTGVIYSVGWITVDAGSSSSPPMEVPEMEPAAAMSCSPSTVTRTNTVTCTVTGATVTGWSFSGGKFSVAGPTDGSTAWGGPMVVSGTVTATISGGNPLSASITVNPRPNFPAVPMPSAAHVSNGYQFYNRKLPTLPLDNAPTTHGLGASFYIPDFTETPGQVPNGGPNQGLYFVDTNTGSSSGASTLTDISQYPWEYSPALDNPGSAFYQAQSATCWAGVTAIIASVTAHEVGASQSHYSETQAALAANNPGTFAEGVVELDASTVNIDIVDVYSAAQAAGRQEFVSPPIAINFYPYQLCP